MQTQIYKRKTYCTRRPDGVDVNKQSESVDQFFFVRHLIRGQFILSFSQSREEVSEEAVIGRGAAYQSADLSPETLSHLMGRARHMPKIYLIS